MKSSLVRTPRKDFLRTNTSIITNNLVKKLLGNKYQLASQGDITEFAVTEENGIFERGVYKVRAYGQGEIVVKVFRKTKNDALEYYENIKDTHFAWQQDSALGQYILKVQLKSKKPDYDESYGLLFLELEKAKETLALKLRRKDQYIEEERIKDFKELVSAVTYLHRRGEGIGRNFHGDLKPDNVFFVDHLNADGSITECLKIGDIEDCLGTIPYRDSRNVSLQAWEKGTLPPTGKEDDLMAIKMIFLELAYDFCLFDFCDELLGKGQESVGQFEQFLKKDALERKEIISLSGKRPRYMKNFPLDSILSRSNVKDIMDDLINISSKPTIDANVDKKFGGDNIKYERENMPVRKKYIETLKFWVVVCFAIGSYFSVTFGNEFPLFKGWTQSLLDYGIKSYLTGGLSYSTLKLAGGLRGLLNTQSLIFAVLLAVFFWVSSLIDGVNINHPNKLGGVKSNLWKRLKPFKYPVVFLITILSAPLILILIDCSFCKILNAYFPTSKWQIIILLFALLLLGALITIIYCKFFNQRWHHGNIRAGNLLLDVFYIIFGCTIMFWLVLILNINPVVNSSFFDLYDTSFNRKNYQIEGYKIPGITISSEEMKSCELDFRGFDNSKRNYRFTLLCNNIKQKSEGPLEIDGSKFSTEFVKENPGLFLNLSGRKLEKIAKYVPEDQVTFYHQYKNLKKYLDSKKIDGLESHLKGSELAARDLLSLLFYLKHQWKAEIVLKMISGNSNEDKRNIGNIEKFFDEIKINQLLEMLKGESQ